MADAQKMKKLIGRLRARHRRVSASGSGIPESHLLNSY